MDDATITAVVAEITPLLVGRAPGKIFQLSRQSLAIDFGLRGEGYLFVSVEPALPRLYLIKRRVRDLEKQSIALTQFGLTLRKELSQMTVSEVDKDPADRIVWFKFRGIDEVGAPKQRSLVAQLTGRSSNVHLLDKHNRILAQLREGRGAGQDISANYHSPPTNRAEKPTTFVPEKRKSISELLDEHYLELAASHAAESRLAAARAQLGKEIARRKRLLKQLENDLRGHANAEAEKRIGDLLLANVGTAKRKGTSVVLLDYFAEGAPTIEIEMDENLTLAEEASRRFESYSRSKRARKQIAIRMEQVKKELHNFERQSAELETNPLADLRGLAGASPAADRKAADAAAKNRIPGTRRYVSADGYEMLVGRAAGDNDNLTFKIAKPNDLWLHAADYPGSHVVVRNPTRKDVPHRTLIEAAQLAAYFSQANKDPKVDVHYTHRKFLSKPKGAAAGLVRLLRFKSIVVTPREAGQRIK
jgi:predicted ribosome quality control (RQC) complex YloA/Tae2 family protein